MKIAVTSQNLRTVSGHAGRARRFLVFDVSPDAEPVEVARLELPRELCMHEFHGSDRHPFDDVNVILTAGCGDGFARRMAHRGIAVATTADDDPVKAVSGYLATAAAEDPASPAPSAPGQGHGAGRHRHRHQHRHDHTNDAPHCGCAGSRPM